MKGIRTGQAAAGLAVVLLGSLLGTQASAQGDSAPKALSAEEVEELSHLSESYLQTRASMVTVNPPALRRAHVSATQGMASRLEEEFEKLEAKGKMYEGVDGGYTKAAVDVTVTESSLEGNTATLEITEDGRLYMPFTAEEVAAGAPEYEEYSLPHTVAFVKQADGTWLLSSDKADSGSGPTPSTQLSAPDTADDGGGAPDEDEGSKEAPASTAEIPDGDSDVQAPTGYDYGPMIAYAHKHWKNYNNDYRKYRNDCTNFISQIMKDGGWKIVGPAEAHWRSNNKKWFYTIFIHKTSYTWAGAENWYWFAKKHSKRTKALNNVYKMGPADVLQADWDRNGNINHTMFVTEKWRGIPYLTYHSSNTHNKSMKKLVAENRGTWWYAHNT